MFSTAAVRLFVARNRKHIQGLLFIVTAAVIWVLASFVVQEVEDEGLSPFLLSYIANSLFIVYLPIDKLIKQRALSSVQWSRVEEEPPASAEGEGLRSEVNSGAPDSSVPQPKLFGYFEKDLFKAAAVVAPLWFLAQFTFNTSLHLTSVTSNTILSSTAGLFTYGLSWLVIGEPFVAHKLVSILVCATGTVVVTLADSNDKQRPSSVAGDALCLLSAGFYACYTVAIKRMLGGDEGTNTVLFFGYVGLVNLVLLAPVLLLLQLASLVDVAQLTASMLGLVVAKGLLDNVLSDYLWARAVLLVGPTIATVGMSVQVPLAVVLDILWKRPEYARRPKGVTLMVLGGWYVLAGFVGINVPPATRPKKLQDSGQADSLDLSEPES